MKKVFLSLLLAITLLLVPSIALGNGFNITPMGPLELDILAGSSATQDFVVTGLEGTLLIKLEDLPLDYEPSEIEVTEGQTITVTFYGSNIGTYEGKILFRPIIGGNVLIGYKVRILANIHLEVDIPNSLILTTTILEPTGPGSGGITFRDTRPPRIYDIVASNVAETAVDIRWTTDEKSTSQVRYWASPSRLSPLDRTYTEEHSVHLTNLIPDTTYYYETMSEDRNGNLRISEEYTFTTLLKEVTPPDIEEPIVEEPIEEEPVIEEPTEPKEPLKPISEREVPWGWIVGIVIGLAVVVSGIIILEKSKKVRS